MDLYIDLDIRNSSNMALLACFRLVQSGGNLFYDLRPSLAKCINRLLSPV